MAKKTISAEEFEKLPKAKKTISAEEFESLPDKGDISATRLKELFAEDVDVQRLKDLSITDVLKRIHQVTREVGTGITAGLLPTIEAGIVAPFTDKTIDEERQRVEQERKAFHEEEPLAAGVSEATGSVLLGGGLAKMGAGAIKQAGLEAGARAAFRGEDATGTAAEGLTGAGLAAVLPPALKGVAKGGAKIAGKAIKVLPNLKNFAQRNAFKATGLGIGSKGVTEEVQKKVGQTLLEEELVPILKRPTKALKSIAGGNEIFIDTLDVPENLEIMERSHMFDFFTSKRKDGLIGEISEDLIKDINKMSKELPKYNLQRDVNEIVADVTKGLAEGTTTITERGIPEEIIIRKVEGTKNLIENLLRVDPDPGTLSNFKTLENIQKLKMSLGEKLHKVFRRVKDTGIDIAEDEIILTKTYMRLKGLIEEIAQGSNVDVDGVLMKGGDYVKKQNARMSNLLTASQRLRKASEKELTAPGSAAALAREITTAVVGGMGAGAFGGDPATGAAAGFLLGGGARRIGRGVEKSVTSRAPQIAFAVSNVADKVLNTKIPRTSSAVIENLDLVAAKLAIAGAPQLSETLKMLIDSNPGQVSTLIPNIIENVPDIFVPSTFASEFDGKLHNTEDRYIFIDDIQKNEMLPPSKKSKIISRMQKHGELPRDIELIMPEIKIPIKSDKTPLDLLMQQY